MTKTLYITLHTLDEKPTHSGMYLLLTKGASRGMCLDYSAEHEMFNCFDGQTELDYAFSFEDLEGYQYWIDLGEMWHV